MVIDELAIARGKKLGPRWRRVELKPYTHGGIEFQQFVMEYGIFPEPKRDPGAGIDWRQWGAGEVLRAWIGDQQVYGPPERKPDNE